MGVALKHEDYDRMLEKLNGNFLYLNDLDPAEDEALITKLIITSFENGTFPMIPSCSCGSTTKETHPDKKIGDRCDYCFTEINYHGARKMDPTIWVKAPDRIDSLINPRFLAMLVRTYSKKAKNIDKTVTVIHYLLDPYYKDFSNQSQIDALRRHGIRRGLNFFLRNTEMILRVLAESPEFDYNEGLKRQVLLVYLQDKDVLFPKQLPLTDKSFNVIERSHIGSYVDVKTLTPYMETVNSIVTLRRLKRKPAQSKLENITAKILFNLVIYYETYIKEFQNDKKGEYRRQIYGSRLPWTTRQVITSITEPHSYDETHLPWCAAIPLLEHHITNYLIRDGYTVNQAKEKVLTAINNYDEDIAKIMDYLIESSPCRTALTNEPGLMFIHNRNPSLKMGSLHTEYITKIKKDLKDITRSISVLALGSLNGDFDGNSIIASMLCE